MNSAQAKMKSLLTQVKHVKITSREVFIHLRKNGELKNKSYQKNLKMLYRRASDTYKMLHAAESILENQPKDPQEKKLTMPGSLVVKSELSAMSKSFKDISFITEAWHFFQKEKMGICFCNSTYTPISDTNKTDGPSVANSSIQNEDYILNSEELRPTNKNLPQTKNQSTLTLSLASGFDELNQYNTSPPKNTSLCIQVLKWALEGKLNLN